MSSHVSVYVFFVQLSDSSLFRAEDAVPGVSGSASEGHEAHVTAGSGQTRRRGNTER